MWLTSECIFFFSISLAPHVCKFDSVGFGCEKTNKPNEEERNRAREGKKEECLYTIHRHTEHPSMFYHVHTELLFLRETYGFCWQMCECVWWCWRCWYCCCCCCALHPKHISFRVVWNHSSKCRLERNWELLAIWMRVCACVGVCLLVARITRTW